MRMSCSIVVISCVLVLAGCAGVPVTIPVQTNPHAGAALKGKVYGGRQPIVGAHVYAYAANTTGYGSASISLLTSNVLSQSPAGGQDGSGNYYVTTNGLGVFSISGEYTCPGPDAQLYLYAVGGNPGAGENSAAGLMIGIGSCDSPNFSTSFFNMDEVSTVATAYALAGFMTDPTHVSSSGSAQAMTGIAHAFSTVANLEDAGSGGVLVTTPAGNGIVPHLEINTLANILAACINSAGPSTTACTTLFSNAMNGTVAPTDTAAAAINIAHNPGANMDNLWGLQVPDAPFQPSLTAEPNDFTMSITYTGGGLDGSGFSPEGIAVDGSGNLWVPNYAASTLTELRYDGTVLSGANGFGSEVLDNPTSVAIDPNGLVAVANFTGGSLAVFDSTGALKSQPQGSGLNKPYGIAIDSADNIWASNFGSNSFSEFDINGNAASGTGGFGGLTEPAGIAADTAGNVWTTNWGAAISQIVEATPNPTPGQAPTLTTISGDQLSNPYGIAIDGQGNIWVTNIATISEFKPDGTPISPDETGYTGGGLSTPYGIAIDGAGNVWAANSGGNANSVSEFSSSGVAISGDNGYVSDSLSVPYGIAIDPSGNVWVASDNTSGPLTEFVGAAVPVVTPLAVGVKNNQLGTRP